MSIKVIIVDDDRKCQMVLHRMLMEFCSGIEVVGIASTVKEAVSLIQTEEPEIVFLDVELPGENGFSLFRYLKDRNFDVIFVTGHSEYAIQAIKIAALDYLLKPIDIRELREIVEKVKQQRKRFFKHVFNERLDILQENLTNPISSEQKIALHTKKGWELFQMNQIVRCEANRAYCIFHLLENRRITVAKSLKEYTELLESANFFRVHRSHMINLEHVVRCISGAQMKVILSDQSLIDVAHRRKEQLQEKIRELVVQ